MHTLGIGLYCCGVAGDDAPSDAPSGNEIVFRHAAKRDAGYVGCNGGEGGMWSVFENQLVVDFVGEDDQVVAPREVGNLLQHLPRAECTSRVVGINQHNAASTRSELAFDIRQLWLPGIFFV